MKQRNVLIAAGVTGVVCFALSWIGSSPSYLTGLHWDTGSFLSQMATTSDRWRRAGIPWTSHLALPQIYMVACAATQLFGGSCFDAFRLLQAVCVGTAGVLFFVAARQLARSELLAGLLAVGFVTAWGTFCLIFQMVDNLVYLPFAVAVLAVCVLRREAWRDRDSALAGALAGAATLVSLQCVIYLIPPLFVAAFLGGARRLHVRARQLAEVVAVFAAVVAGWGLVLGLTTSASVAQVFDAMTDRPKASFVPRNLYELRALGDTDKFLKHLGMGIAEELTTTDRADALYRQMPLVGLWLLVTEISLVAVAVVGWWRKKLDSGVVFVLFTLLAFTVATSLYHDLLSEKYKRYDFLPLLVFLAVAAIVGSSAERWRTLAVRGVAAATLVLIVVQTATAMGNTRRWHAELPYFPRGLNDYYGRDQLSWIGYFRKLGRQYPHACRFVFSTREFSGIRYNHEVTAGLATQLPAYAMVGTWGDIFKWKFKPYLIPPTESARLRPCDWVSPMAQAALQLQ